MLLPLPSLALTLPFPLSLSLSLALPPSLSDHRLPLMSLCRCSDDVTRDLERLQKKIAIHKDTEQRLRSRVNDLNADRLKIQQGIQERCKLEDQKDSLTKQNVELQREIEVGRRLSWIPSSISHSVCSSVNGSLRSLLMLPLVLTDACLFNFLPVYNHLLLARSQSNLTLRSQSTTDWLLDLSLTPINCKISI